METTLREYRSDDSQETAALFYETVHSVNLGDYDQAQVDAWAPRDRDLDEWDRSFKGKRAFVAIEGKRIVGFGDVDVSGYLDRLYVRRDRQRRGIATSLCDALESVVESATITTCASITAKPFFEGRGFRVVKRQEVERQGIRLVNFVMVKRLR